jgi:hypothetical protein
MFKPVLGSLIFSSSVTFQRLSMETEQGGLGVGEKMMMDSDEMLWIHGE